jgi:hypothetical protein
VRGSLKLNIGGIALKDQRPFRVKLDIAQLAGIERRGKTQSAVPPISTMDIGCPCIYLSPERVIIMAVEKFFKRSFKWRCGCTIIVRVLGACERLRE